MFVDEEPGGTALFPDAGVANGSVDGFAVLHFGGEMHGDGGPGDVAVASNLEFLASGQREGFDVIEEFLADPSVVFFPAVVGEGRNIVEDQAVVLGVEFGGVGGIAGTPSGTIVVDEFTEGGGIGGFLLGAGAGEGKQAAKKGD